MPRSLTPPSEPLNRMVSGKTTTRKPAASPIVKAFAMIALVFLVGFVCLVISVNTSVKSLLLPSEHIGLEIYDRHDKLISTILADRDTTPVPLNTISRSMRQAIITSEDRAFYQHIGVNPLAIVRAMCANMMAGHAVQGGSTITQQLVKNLYFPDEERSLYSKAREAVLAIELERRYSKDRILEAYLNYIYFGQGTFGVERAAQRYFGKPASKLTLAESAYLAGLVSAPSTLSSPSNRHKAIARQQGILSNMVASHYISPEAAQQAKKEKLPSKEYRTAHDSNWYYISYVLQLLTAQFGEEKLNEKGLKIYTNLDVGAQALAQKYLTEGIRRAPAGISQGALVCLSVDDASVVALVGGVNSYKKSPWDRALNPHTAGSAFKPFVYLAGLTSGAIQKDTVLDDSPIVIRLPQTDQTYAPRNFDGRFLGPLSVRKAIALSRNVCAVKLAQNIGLEPIVNTAKLAGVDSPIQPTLSIALGSCAVSPLELASAYSTFARGGVRSQPMLIRRMVNREGKVIGVGQINQQRVFDQEPVAQLVDIMQDVVTEGTGSEAQLANRKVAGKTGTSDGGKDVWFVGFTPDTVTAVWGGNDQDQSVAGTQVTGGAIAARIWKNYMQGYYQLYPMPQRAFAQPINPLLHDSELNIYAPAQVAASDEEIPAAPDRESRSSEHKERKSSRGGGVGRFFRKLFSIFR